MRLIGTAEITKWQVLEDGSEVEIEKRVENNVITKRTFDDLAQSAVIFTNALRIAFSTTTTAVNFENLTHANIIAVGALRSYTQTPSTLSTPGDVTYVCRFNPPAAARTINSLAIVTGAEVADTSGVTRNSYTHLLLGSAVTQQTTEIIDVSYKITVNWGATTVSPIVQQVIETKLGFNSYPALPFSHPFSNLVAATGFPLSSNFSKVFSSEVNRNKYGSLSNSTTVFSTAYRATLSNPTTLTIPYTTNSFSTDIQWGSFFVNVSNGVALSNAISLGACLRNVVSLLNLTLGTTDSTSVLLGEDTTAITTQVNKASNISNVFSHSETAIAPMYDINFLANSSWRPNISEAGGALTSLPLHYLLKVTQAGGIGVGRYKLYTSAMSGWQNNTYVPRGQLHFAISGLSQAGINETNNEFIFNHRWVYDWTYSQDSYKFVTYKRKAGIAVLDVKDRSWTEFKKYTLSTYTQLGSLINDIATNPSANLIYAATSTGLFSINTNTDTVTQLSTDPCLCVVVGLGGAVFAVFKTGAGVGRLSNSISGFSVALPMGAAVINWDNIWRLAIDPTSTNYNLMIYEGSCPKHTTQANTIAGFNATPINRYKIHWWNTASNFISTNQVNINSDASNRNTSSRYFEHELLVLPTNKSISVTNGLWIYPGNRRDSTVTDMSQVANLFTLDTLGVLPLEVKYDLSGFRINGSWRDTETSLTTINAGANSHIVTDSGDYHLGFHAAAPFFTMTNQDGWLTSVHTGKPTLSATAYNLRLIFGMHLAGGSNIADGVTSTPTRTPSNFYNLSVNESGGTTVSNLAVSNAAYYNANNSITGAGGRGIFKFNVNYSTFGNKQIMFFVSPNFGQQGGTLTEAFPLNVSRILQPRNSPNESNFGGIGYLDPLRRPAVDTNDNWLQAWQWNGTSWVVDPDNTGVGRPIHTTTEDLIEGTRISWIDLQPGNTQNLILNQYYNFVRLTDPSQVLCETTGPALTYNSNLFIRQFNTATISGTVPGTPFRVRANEAPLGSAPNVNFLGLIPFANGGSYTATINGVAAPVIINTSTTPTAGTIHVTSLVAGEFYFNSANAGQPYTIQYTWLSKYHPTEVL